MLCDTEPLQRGGVNGIIFENMFDVPSIVDLEQKRAHIAAAAEEIKAVDLLVGIENASGAGAR